MRCEPSLVVKWMLAASLTLAAAGWQTPTSAETAPSAGGAESSRATPLVADTALEARVMEVAQELRCLVCQNETIAASQAELAQDLRKQIRNKLQQGQSAREILDFMVARYGDFVLYRPALKGKTILLWLGPFVFLLAAFLSLICVIRKRRMAAPPALSHDQQARARALLTSGTDAPASSPQPPHSTSS